MVESERRLVVESSFCRAGDATCFGNCSLGRLKSSARNFDVVLKSAREKARDGKVSVLQVGEKRAFNVWCTGADMVLHFFGRISDPDDLDQKGFMIVVETSESEI